MKRVLLCGSFVSGDLFQQRFVTPPLGVWRLASYLNAHGHEVDVYDQGKPGCASDDNFRAIIQSKEWDIIGFSVLIATLEYDLAKICEAKNLCPNALIVAGGNGAALNYQQIMDNSPVEIVITSEGEYPMRDLCDGKPWQDIPGIVFKRNAKILTADDYWEITNTLDVAAMDAGAYWEKTASLYDDPDYGEINTFRLFTSNYCPMGCKFCTLTLWKKYSSGCTVPVVALTPDQVLEMIHRVVDSYANVRQIFFVDDDFFLLKGRGEALMKLIIAEKMAGELPDNLKFIALTNINRLNKDNLRLMSAAGVRILSIGVESTHQGKLDSMNKKQTVETIWTNTQMILDAGIKPYYTLLLFTPYETVESLVTDLAGFRRLSSMGVGLSVEPYLIPLPGTPLWEERVPERTRWCEIEGTKKRIRKGFAWLPVAKDVRKIFDVYEDFFPKYKWYRFDTDGVGHKEKNYAAGIMLDCLEIVLKVKFSMAFDGRLDGNTLEDLYHEVNSMDAMDVDIVGDFTKRDEEEFPH